MDLPLANAPVTGPEPQQRNSYDSWLNKRSEVIKNLEPAQQHEIYDFMQNTLKQLSKHKNFTIRFTNSQNQIRGFIEAIKVFGPRIKNNQFARLTFTNSDGIIDYKHISPSTIRYLDDVFNNPDMERVKDSNDDLIEIIENLQSIKVEFVQRKDGTRKIAGFFPFLNKSEYDLRKFGIFKSINDPEMNNSCLIQTFKYSGLLSEDEVKMLTSFIKDRYIPQTTLKEISELFKIHINCRTYHLENNKTSHEDYGLEYKEQKSLKIIILNKHYMLNECVLSPKKFHIVTLIKNLIKHNLLVPMTEKQINYLDWNYRPKNCDFEGYSRLINIPDKTTNTYKKLHKVNQTAHFFGYDPKDENIDFRLKELQNVINKIPLRNKIDVSLYYKFSELMQKIMFEYGCFDNVYEYSGRKAQNIRAQ